MVSRFPTVMHLDFCYKPVRISKNGITMFVPCGKCNGCLLKKANTWSFRLGDEIENSSNSIFFTLTYDNIHVPKLESRVEDGLFHWFSAADNFRFNGKCDVLRDPVSFYSKFNLYAPLKNYNRNDMVIGYLSKSDIQLYLKLLRKDIYDNFNISTGSFRYYIVGEYGPGKSQNQGKYRPHFHGIIFPCNGEISSYLLEGGLFKSWQMCDRTLFEEYTKCCDSGARHYVTEYVTGTTLLPKLLSETKEIKPFFLASKKNGVLGVGHFDTKEVCKNIESGIDEYIKQVPRIERAYLFRYPPSLINSLFPKCSRFRLLSFDGLLRVYGFLYDVRQAGFEFASIFDGYDRFSSQDLTAANACLKVCDLMAWTPYHYTEVLVDFYTRREFFLLRVQYEFQINHINDPYLCIGWYSNWKDFIEDGSFDSKGYFLGSVRYIDASRWFVSSFGLSWPIQKEKIDSAVDNYLYQKEVDNIIAFADKSKKVNSVVGLDPHIV